MWRLLAPYVIRESAPDGKGWHRCKASVRPRRFVTAMGARYAARTLAAHYADANAEAGKQLFKFTVRFKASRVGSEIK